MLASMAKHYSILVKRHPMHSLRARMPRIRSRRLHGDGRARRAQAVAIAP